MLAIDDPPSWLRGIVIGPARRSRLPAARAFARVLGIEVRLEPRSIVAMIGSQGGNAGEIRSDRTAIPADRSASASLV